MDAWAVALAVLLSIWLLLSTLVQLSARWPRLAVLWRWDPLGLLPQYHFFCPTPVRHDYHLLVRTLDAQGATSGWREVIGPVPRRWWNVAWNPDRRAYKSLCDLMQVVDHEGDNPRSVQVSVAYLSILTHATAVAHAWRVPGASRVQFLLAVSRGPHSDTPPQAVFMSAPHRLAGPDESDPEPGPSADGDARLHGRGRLLA